MQDFIPLYPLYQLLFADHGLSAAQISILFVIWSTTAFVLEVPSGAWADTYSRRKLLVLGALISALGYAAWITVPSFAGFALGFVLWGVAGVLQKLATNHISTELCTVLFAAAFVPVAVVLSFTLSGCFFVSSWC